MKKQIVLATIATLATTSAYATRARMNALGQKQNRGSFYINDTRNVFRNAARINQTNNYIVTEWGDATADQDTDIEKSTEPKAEGGFFKNAGTFNYGVYLGSQINDKDLANAGATGSEGYANQLGATGGSGVFGNTSFQDRSNDLDLFFGGDMGVEWGARLNYTSSKTEPSTAGQLEAKHSALELGLGMVMGDLNAYVNYTLNDDYENITGSTSAGIKAEDDGTMNLGVGYKWMDYTFFVDYDKKAHEYTNGTGATADTTEMTVLTVGAGYTKEVSSTSRMFADVSFVSTKGEDVDSSANTTHEVSRSELPLTVGFETDATSWLTLRGSVSQNVFINSNKVTITGSPEASSTRTNTTNVQAGATLNFGKLMVDGMIGTSGADGNADGDENGVLSTDRLMGQVAVHYWF